MTETTAMVIGVAVGLILAIVVGVGYRLRKRRIAPRSFVLWRSPSHDWTDEDVDRLLAALESADDDEHEEAFVSWVDN